MTAEGTVRCAITQVRLDDENRQRILAVELAAAEGGDTAGGMLVLLFGLRPEAGATLAIDEAAALDPPRFSTCLPTGCLVPLAFDAATVLALKGARRLW